MLQDFLRALETGEIQPLPMREGSLTGARVRPDGTVWYRLTQGHQEARVLGEDGSVVEGLYAAGADVGGISSGGWSSGLAAALVFGRIAAEEALR